MTRTTEGVITSWNPGAERLFGYTATEIIGRSARVLMPAGEHWLFDPRTESDERRATQTSEAMRLRKDGTTIDVVVTVAAIRSVGGQVAGYAVIYNDNAQSKRAQAEMQAARDLALEAVRVRSEFLTTMSHEVRTARASRLACPQMRYGPDCGYGVDSGAGRGGTGAAGGAGASIGAVGDAADGGAASAGAASDLVSGEAFFLCAALTRRPLCMCTSAR